MLYVLSDLPIFLLFEPLSRGAIQQPPRLLQCLNLMWHAKRTTNTHGVMAIQISNTMSKHSFPFHGLICPDSFSYLDHKKKMDSWEHLEWSHGRYVTHCIRIYILVAMHTCLVDLHCLKSVSAVCKQVIDPHSSAPSDSTMFSTPPIHTTTT